MEAQKSKTGLEQCDSDTDCFFYYLDAVHHEYAPLGQTGNKEYYQEVLYLCHAVRCKRLELWDTRQLPGPVSCTELHHEDDSAPPHSSHLIQGFLAKHSIPQAHQAPYSADMAPYNFWLFPRLKTLLKGSHFDKRDNIIQNVTSQLHTIPKQAFQKCFQQWKDCWA
jgi:hypothetical protein